MRSKALTILIVATAIVVVGCGASEQGEGNKDDFETAVATAVSNYRSEVRVDLATNPSMSIVCRNIRGLEPLEAWAYPGVQRDSAEGESYSPRIIALLVPVLQEECERVYGR